MLPRCYEDINQTTERLINLNHLFICLHIMVNNDNKLYVYHIVLGKICVYK